MDDKEKMEQQAIDLLWRSCDILEGCGCKLAEDIKEFFHRNNIKKGGQP